ncbi:HLA class II histocompatibility antigen, DRB1-4 beta chain-like, partial [Python bivittatus]|uniref:HLA class II histocompatibility antigen, DRB1-4 beta chain-like n=1 Tax=Python bivittatus TaxID=176946 RepID=A0A9F2REC9_PYTBI
FGKAAHFLVQWKSDCHFFNGTQRVRYLDRYFYDRQEFVRFDSDVGKFMAVTEFGQKDADYWNSHQEVQIKKAEVDGFCRCHYGAFTYQAEKTRRLIGRR